jgi:photosystem II stability/assembly factor-like uncharacterized protein
MMKAWTVHILSMLCLFGAWGCLSEAWQECPGPRGPTYCPESRSCAGERCVAKSQIDACTTKTEGERCSTSPAFGDLNAVAFSGADQATIVGQSGTLLVFDGFQLSPQDIGLTVALNDVAFDQSGRGVMGCVGGTVGWLDGGTWRTKQVFDIDFDLEAVWISPQGDYWVAGDSGTLARSRDGQSYEQIEDIVEGDFTSIWGIGTIVFVLSDGGLLYRFDTATDQRELFDLKQVVVGIRSVELNGMWGAAADDFFLVGKKSTIVHFKQGTWQLAGPLPIPDNIEFLDVWGKPDGSRTIAIGASGTLLSFDGQNWTKEETGTNAALAGIAVYGEDVLVVGVGGVILKSDDGKWIDMSQDGTCRQGACISPDQ